MARIIAAPNLQLPWSSTVDDNNRYWKIFLALFIPALLVSVVIPFIDVPEPTREELEKLPPQLAKVVLEKKEVPTPTPTPVPKATPTPEPKKEEPTPEPKATPKPTPKPVESTPRPTPPPAKVVKAREEAQAEINQFADQLSDLRESFDLSEVQREVTQGSGQAAEMSRDVITSGATKGSGGINTSNLSRDTGGNAISAQRTTEAVESKLDTGDGEGVAAVADTPVERSARSREEIRKIMDKNRGALDAIYNRALRKNPALEGRVTFKIEIDANGRVVNVTVVSSELGDPDLERKLAARIRLINFGAKNVEITEINYDIDFLPY